MNIFLGQRYTAVKNNGDGNSCLNRKKAESFKFDKSSQLLHIQKQIPAQVQGKWE